MSWIQSDLQPSNSYVPPSWSDATDEEIVELLTAHYNDEIDLTQYWSIGDERVVSLSAMMNSSEVSELHVAQDVTFVLTEIGGKTLTTPINGHTTCAFQVDQKDCLIEPGYMHNENVSGVSSFEYNTCDRRGWCNNTYKNAIPSSIRGIFKQFKNPSVKAYYDSTIILTDDYFCLRSESEIFDSVSYSFGNEGNQIEYYKTSSNRIKKYYYNNSRWLDANYWERSVRKNTSHSYCVVDNSGSKWIGTDTDNKYLAPFGVI